MVKIILENNKSRVVAEKQLLIYLRNNLKIKAKGYFWNPAFRSGNWDGYIRYISEVNGAFSTGLLDQVIDLIKKAKRKFEIIDNRDLIKPVRNLKQIGNKVFFKYQLKALSCFFNNQIYGVPFLRGIMAEATNAGKSVIAAGIIGSFSNRHTSIILINNKDLYDQTLRDLRKIFGQRVGEINAKSTNWRDINVCMVQTLNNRIKKNIKYRDLLAKVSIVIVDESDEMVGRKDCKNVLNTCYNAPVRIAFTGTALKNKGKIKDKNIHKGSTKNQEELAYFGPIIHTISNKDLVKKGISTPPKITIVTGNKESPKNVDYYTEYEIGIIKNNRRHKRIWDRVEYHISKKRTPIIILFRFHKHGRRLLKRCPEKINRNLSVVMIHSKSSVRESSIRDFNRGKIDILICSMIIKRGMNIPRAKVLLNAAGGDSEKNVLQILGRILRKHHSKKAVYLDDFWDIGHYLKRHSLHRLKYYLGQSFEVREKFNKG